MHFTIKYCLFILLCWIAHTAIAENIFRYEDAQGRVTYSDQPAYTGKQTKIPTKTYRSLYRVKRVYDGDTISLVNNQRVRLLGINTPEVEGRHKNSEPGGIAAKEWLQQQLESGQVYLEFDEEKQDRYKRLLAHLYLPNGTHLNVALVKNGLAVVNLIPPNLNHADKLIQAQNKAQKEKLGIWSRPEYAPKPLTAITKKYFGWNRYSGTPTSIKKGRKYTRLIFNDKTDFRIANKHLHLFPKLDTYLDKSLEIHGWMSRKRNRYSILIQHPSALILH